MASSSVKASRGSSPQSARDAWHAVRHLPGRFGRMEALSPVWPSVEGVVPSSLAVFPPSSSTSSIPYSGTIWGAAAYEVVAGFALRAGVGAALGLLLGMRRFWRFVLEPYINYLAATPKIIFLPIMMVMFGG